MKSPRKAAIAAAVVFMDGHLSEEAIEFLINDKSEMGKTLRKFVVIVEKAIEQDRREIQKANLPS